MYCFVFWVTLCANERLLINRHKNNRSAQEGQIFATQTFISNNSPRCSNERHLCSILYVYGIGCGRRRLLARPRPMFAGERWSPGRLAPAATPQLQPSANTRSLAFSSNYPDTVHTIQSVASKLGIISAAYKGELSNSRSNTVKAARHAQLFLWGYVNCQLWLSFVSLRNCKLYINP